MQEKEKFAEIKERLKALLQHQITNFRYAFPFGRPEGALKVSWMEELRLMTFKILKVLYIMICLFVNNVKIIEEENFLLKMINAVSADKDIWTKYK